MSFYYADQFAVHELEAGALRPFDAVLVDNVRGDRRTRGRTWSTLERRFQNQTSGAAGEQRRLLIRRQFCGRETRRERQQPQDLQKFQFM